MHFISVDALQSKIANEPTLFVLDIREQYERDVYSISSTHIPMAEVCERITEIPASNDVVIVCNSGKRAEALANLLTCEHQRTNLYVLDGGMTAWMEANN